MYLQLRNALIRFINIKFLLTGKTDKDLPTFCYFLSQKQV